MTLSRQLIPAMVDVQHWIRRCPNSAARAFLRLVIPPSRLFWKCALTFTFLHRVCLMKMVNQASRCQVPVTGARPGAPQPVPSRGGRGLRLLTLCSGLARHSTRRCQPSLKVCIVESRANMAAGLHLLPAGVCLCSPPARPEDTVEAKACWFTASLTGGGGWLGRRGVSTMCVCVSACVGVRAAAVVLIGLVNRIFHKRSDGPEQFLFSVRNGMRLFLSLKSDSCSGSGCAAKQPFCLPATLCFCCF